MRSQFTHTLIHVTRAEMKIKFFPPAAKPPKRFEGLLDCVMLVTMTDGYASIWSLLAGTNAP